MKPSGLEPLRPLFISSTSLAEIRLATLSLFSKDKDRHLGASISAILGDLAFNGTYKKRDVNIILYYIVYFNLI